jgi:hypothetical protein
MVKRKRARIGDVYQVPLGNGRFAYGVVLERPKIGFYDYCDEGLANIQQVTSNTIAFMIWVHDDAFRAWSKVAHTEPSSKVLQPSKFVKQDPITGELFATITGSEEIPVRSKEEASRMERAAVWEPEHVADRLRDHFDGRPNKWVGSMRLK